MKAAITAMILNQMIRGLLIGLAFKSMKRIISPTTISGIITLAAMVLPVINSLKQAIPNLENRKTKYRPWEFPGLPGSARARIWEEAVTNIKEAICTYINASEEDEIAVQEERFEFLLVIVWANCLCSQAFRRPTKAIAQPATERPNFSKKTITRLMRENFVSISR